MSSFRSVLFLLAILGFSLFEACETDIEVIAPKRDVTIIYGLLEADQFRHYIRINRAFVGEESASELASKNGITEYAQNELSARIIELNQDSVETGNRWDLIRTTLTTKEEGAFNNDSNVVYYFDAQLNAERIYRIVCDVNVAGEEPKTVSASTNLIGNQAFTGGVSQIRLNRPGLSGVNSSNGGSDRTADEVTLVNNTDYAQEFSVTWTSVNGGFRYTTYMRFYYSEFDKSAGTLLKRDSISFSIATRDFPEAAGEVRFPSKNAEDFYSRIGAQVEDIPVTSNIQRIVSDTLQFFLEVANEELAIYIDVNQPISDVAQERPEYTNVKNGLGIFASRLVVSTRSNAPQTNGRILDASSLEELLYSNLGNSGVYTRDKQFTLPGRCVIDEATGERCQ
ncbi:MAG: hypothetical protein Salg2KO_01060 [Salibacteraceae bacterium]